MAHIMAIIIKAGTSLSTFKVCSSVIPRYPRTKMIISNNSMIGGGVKRWLVCVPSVLPRPDKDLFY
ncbi:MAG: hypothetical protein ACI9P8_002006 [Bacteroidia bacterium]|jgi:hypothetical protein